MRHGWGCDASIQKSVKQFWFSMSSVESVAELAQVALDVFVIQTMKRPGNESFCIRDDDVSPVEHIVLSLPWSHRRFMLEAVLAEPIVRLETVGAYCTASRNAGLSKGSGAPTVKALDFLDLNEARFAIFPKPKCDKSFRAPRTTPSLTWIGSPEVRFVHFDNARQLVQGIAMSHCIPDLVQHEPSARIVDVQFFAQLECGMTPFVLGDQEDCPEPLMQGRTTPVKHRPGRSRHLSAATLALPEVAGCNLSHRR